MNKLNISKNDSNIEAPLNAFLTSLGKVVLAFLEGMEEMDNWISEMKEKRNPQFLRESYGTD
jgi:hypothetical protein